ncbi:MAG: glycosyltransferase family 4 protein [Candidatus Odinarchaeia archaeon]
MVEMGYNVQVISSYPINNNKKRIQIEMHEGIKIIRVPSLLAKNPGLSYKLLFYLSFTFSSFLALHYLEKPKYIIGLHPPPPFLLFNSFILTKIYGAEYILRVTDFWPNVFFDYYSVFNFPFLKKSLEIYSQVIYALPSLIIAFTDEIKALLLDFGIHKSKICQIEMAVNTEIYKPFKNKKELFKELGLSFLESKFIVLYAGAFALTYDFDIFLKSANYLSSNYDVEFILLGDGDSRNQIKYLLKKYDLKNVLLIPPVIGSENVAKFINISDVCIVPLKQSMITSMNSRPSKIFEFWSCGKPIIVVSEGKLANYVEQSDAGIAIRTFNHEDLGKAILNLYHDDDYRQRLSKNARNFVLSKHTIKNLKSQISSIL